MNKPSKPGGNPKSRESPRSGQENISSKDAGNLRRTLWVAGKEGWYDGENSEARLYNMMSREMRGSKQDLRTPFWMSKTSTNGGKDVRTWVPRSQIVGDLWKRVESVNLGKFLTAEEQELLLNYEHDEADDISEQSSFLPWSKDGPEKVLSVYTDKPNPWKNSAVDSRALIRSEEWVTSLIPTGKIHRMSVEEAVAGLPGGNAYDLSTSGMDGSTNSGWIPRSDLGYLHGWKPSVRYSEEENAEREEVQRLIIEMAVEYINRCQAGEVVHLRAFVAKRLAQKADELKRKRIVIALNKPEPAVWRTITAILLPELKSKVVMNGVAIFNALSDLPYHDVNCQVMLKQSKAKQQAVLSGDYSGFDASIPPEGIVAAGRIVGRWVSDGTPMCEQLARSMAYHCQLITPNKIWDEQPSSMKSGSGFTNLGDSLWNLMMLRYGHEIGNYKIEQVMVQGDDFNLFGDGVTPESVSDAVGVLGAVLHPDKQMFQIGVSRYLQRLNFHGRIGGVASVFRTLGHVMSYESMTYNKKEWNWATDIIRARMQIENTVFSPFFENLVSLVADGDKYRLGTGYSPSELLSKAKSGIEVILRSMGAYNKGTVTEKSAEETFRQSAVDGVLRGEVLPPFGSQARFSRAYGNRAVFSVTPRLEAA
uniref:Putative replicase n=1 Tax=Tatsystermes virus TaxID=2796634 RepID=A0A7T7GVC7_9VIRU|nr:putative replicase [Tatsystermes virus]